MKKKGFTLVELLAVIVILAVISLIATPLILGVIEKTKIGALENSVNGLIESANMYYANNTIKGEAISETTFDFEDGVQVSDKKLEYKGKVYNGKLILHASGEVAVCIDDAEHYAYKNKNTDEIVSGLGTCKYDGTTGNFSSNSSINDLRGQIIPTAQIEESGDNALITIPEEGHYDETSKISIPIETIKNEVSNLTNKIITTADKGDLLYTASTNNDSNVKISYTTTQDSIIQFYSSYGSSWGSTLKVNGVSYYNAQGNGNMLIPYIIPKGTTLETNYYSICRLEVYAVKL